jgi:DNA-binding response OmpR family regulator
MGRILIADDHDSLRRGLAQALAEAGHEIEEAPNGNAAIEKLHEGFFDVVVSDLKMGGSTGLDVLKTTKTLHPSSAVILMTAFGSVSTAVEAMKIGAFDYVQKPFEIEEMEIKVDKALELRRMQHQIDYLRHAQGDIYDFDRIIGSSGALEKVLGIVRKVAKANTTVLVRGETGTGKELIAGAIHHNSHRAARTFIKVNCAALQENLLESELFGHEKGAFTGADKQRIARVRAVGRHADDQGGRAAHCRHQSRPAVDGGRGPLPRGPVLPAERGHDRHAAAAGAQGRRAGACRVLHPPLLGRAEEEDRRPRAGSAEAADALQLAGQHPRAGERDRARDAAGRRGPDRD